MSTVWDQLLSSENLTDSQLMRMAIEEGKKCESVDTAFNVGAIITKNGRPSFPCQCLHNNEGEGGLF